MKTIQIDNTWTLFLDRDGVINRRLIDDYVKTWAEFEFMPFFKESLTLLSPLFSHILVVTNQQGIGKGLMSEQDLARIHQNMQSELQGFSSKVIIDKVYHCPSLKSANDINRKPEIGMALQAKKDFPLIEFDKSIMIGDSISDMEFGRRAGMITIFFDQEIISPEEEQLIDYKCNDWKEVVALFLNK
ncbi:MAG: HAD-IIIA family hydrolase [Thermoflexibacter sp.]|jgi:D-glycero-D-manno-heptose 1,7-bisphosphate phosphatase|nr:HAD-IIIA family hydrolase [Thermoflexibacter sp.]